MAESHFSSAEPAYVTRLGLSQRPFADACSDGGFYEGAHRGQTRDLILHLVRSTQAPVLLTAQKGLGKTTLLNSLYQSTSSDLRFCLIDAEIKLPDLFPAISRALSVNQDAVVDNLDALLSLLARLKKRKIKLVLLIDDVDAIEASVLEQLYRLLESDDHLVQAVFTNEIAPSALLQRYTGIQSVTLLPLEKMEIAPFLLKRLAAVGHQDALPFSEKEVHVFYRKSSGNPAHVCQLAHQQLLFAKPQTKIFNFPEFKIPIKPIQVLLAGLGIIAITSIMVFQDTINSLFVEQELEQVQAEDNPVELADEITTVDITQQDEQSSDSEREELSKLLAELETEVTQTSPTIEPDASQVPGESSLDEVVTTETLPETPVIPESVANSPLFHDKKWILEQKGTAYTFQLKGAWTEQELDDYVSKYALVGDLAKFASLRNGKPWHVLLYGVYQNKDQALTESKAWPEPLNTLPTWLRRFDSVQKQIRDKGVSP